MADEIKKILEKELTCPLCMDIFKQPKRLQCDHVYCKVCLEKLAEHSDNVTISCPECRVHTVLPNDVSNFPTDFRLNRFIEAYRNIKSGQKAYSHSGNSGSSHENCHDHPTQPFAIYCKTCKKLLCRDCVLKSKDHESHEYGFFTDVTPAHCEELLTKCLTVANRAGPVLQHALKKVSSTKSNITSHAEKCQRDIDLAFKQLYDVLRDIQEALKVEAATYYKSAFKRFKQQEDCLKEFHMQLNDLTSSVESAVVDSDENFLSNLEVLFKQIESLDKNFPSLPLDVAEPQPLAVQIVSKELLRNCLRSQCFLRKVANPNMCTIEESLLTNKQIGEQIEISVTLADSDGNTCQSGDNFVEVELTDYQGKSVSTKADLKIKSLSPDCSWITFTPNERGEHKLNVKVNGAHIMCSPFSFTVNISPTLYSEPITIIHGLKQPTGLTSMNGIVTATEMGENQIIEIDSKFCVRQLYHLVGVNKLTQDSDLNAYVTTIGDNKLHKICKGRESILTIGKLGNGKAEFNYPNGLRVSTNNELYVCDSNNHRIQVFNLDLEFKRELRNKFDFPSDVDFDESGRVYVVDFRCHCINVFTSDEHHVSTIKNSIFSTFTLHSPINLIVLKGHIYITNYGKHDVLVCNMTGEMVATFGGDHLHHPEGITVDDNGFVYVTSHNSKIFVF